MSTSLFGSYVSDTAEIERRCFEDDWDNCKIEKILLSYDKTVEISECKRIMLTNYKQLRVVYRYLSCFGVMNDVFCVTLNPFLLFASQSKICDNHLIRMRDLECIFMSASTKALKIHNERAPEKAMTRREFIEVIGRLAIDKYLRNKIVKSSSRALSLLMTNQAFLAHIKEYENP